MSLLWWGDFSLGFGVRAMDDQTLLARYAATRDAGAFEELARRHAGLVKTTCVRVLGNSHDAEEVAQECFLELARHADQVHSSVAGWLHRAATSRSLNALRSRLGRRVRERVAGRHSETLVSEVDITTFELQRIIEGTLKELPEELRRPMILHYFDGHSQREVATELGVNQSTISRRMQDALRQLRERLTQAGYVASAPAMMVLMQDKVTAAVGDSPMSEIAVSGAAGKAVAGSTTLASLWKSLVAFALPIVSFLVFGGWISLAVAVGVALYVASYRPNWVKGVFASLGVPDIYNQPTFCLSKWNWTTPPRGWRINVVNSVIWSIALLCLSLTFAIGTDQVPWGIVLLGGTVSVALGVHAIRILSRVRECQRMNTGSDPLCADHDLEIAFGKQFTLWGPIDASWTWFDAVQLTGIGLAGVSIASQLLLYPQSKQVRPAVLLAGLIGTWMFASGVRLFRLLLVSTWSVIAQDNPSIPSVDVHRGSAGASPSRQRFWTGTLSVLALGVVTVIGLSAWTVWNPAAVRGISVSLAAIQTSMLGWMVYRLAAYRHHLQPSLVRRVMLVVLVGCFVLNSGVCLANWLK